MLTLTLAAQKKRAVLIGAPGSETAEVRTDDKLKVYRFTFDLNNKVAEVYLTNGNMASGQWDTGGETVDVRFDAYGGRANPLHDDCWGYLRTLMQANGGELSLAMLEQVIVDRELLVNVVEP